MQKQLFLVYFEYLFELLVSHIITSIIVVNGIKLVNMAT